MASTIDQTLVGELYDFLRASRWSDAVTFYQDSLTREERSRAEFRLPYAIALIREGKESSGVKLIDRGLLAVSGARADLRRWAVPYLVDNGSLELAVQLLDRMIEANPDVEDLRLRASLRGRLKRFDGAIDDARKVAEALPDDVHAQRACLQLFLQGGLIEEAGAFAQSIGMAAARHPQLANVTLLALTRSGRMEKAADLATRLSDSPELNEVIAAAIVRTLYDAGRIDDAIETGERLLEEGWDHEGLRSSLGRAYLDSHLEDRYQRALEHLREGLDVDPNDAKMNSAMGDALLRSRSYETAIPFLKKACELQPKAAQTRALYARALKQAGRYAEAGVEFRRLLDLQPSSPRWARYAAGALSQAGRRREAAELFDKFVSERRSTLPRDFEQGLEALWDKVDSVAIPQARLDWAWSLRNDLTNDRQDWERRAKWGHLADHYLLDWLECRDDRVHDAMKRLADLTDADRVLSEIDRSKGMVLASAHIGPMYAGPLALELLGVRSRWLASTPSVARTSYASSLISTSDQDDMQVARAFMLSLRKGFSVVAAVDGAINLAAPRIPFEGQEMTYSSFAARTAHRVGVPSVFCAPRWEGGKIGFVIERMPDPHLDEDADSHAHRWRQAFLASLRNYLGGEPENLRLSGGLWRHVR